MSAQDRAIQKLARELAGIKKEVVSWRGPQADYTSIENGGNFTFKDGDGNVTAVVGGQDDGSNTIRHVDGPTPAVPAGLSAHVDGPIIQAAWDGTFETETTYDWAFLEVEATGPSGELVRATINDATGGSVAFTATASGVWTVVARSVSRAEKRSLDGDAGTVEVKITDLSGAIEAVQDSANGKNKVTYSSHAPTEADPGIFDDTWFVGQVGRPNDVVEATNLATNPSFEASATVDMAHANVTLTNPVVAGSPSGGRVLRAVMKTGTHGTYEFSGQYSAPTNGAQWAAAALMSKPGGGNSSRWRGVRLADTVIGGSTEYTPITGITDSSGWTRQVATKQLRTTASYARFVVYYQGSAAMGSAPVAGDVYETDSWIIATGDTEASALASVQSFFDGDTEDGETDNDPHYRWTGTPHASTSEKYLPALDIGESDNWNVIEQYRHNGTGWERVELSHMVFSSVDLGKATVGELDGIRIMGQTIRGQQLSGDAIDGKVITGATYRTTGGTGSWSDDGLFIAQPDGTSMVRFPTDGSPLSLTASDVQIDRASITDLDLSYGSVRSGGALTLASGVTAPASPPELTTGWRKHTTLEPYTDAGHDAIGLAYWGEGTGHWVRAINVWGSAGDTNDAIELYDYVTGEYQRGFIIDINPRYDITIMGDIVYVFGAGHTGTSDRNFIDGYDLNTGVRTSRHEYTRTIQAKNALGNDGTNLIVASVYNHELWVHRRNPVTGVQSGPDMKSGANTWPDADASALYGVSISGSELTVIPTVAARVYTINGSVLTWKTDTANASGYAGWTNPGNVAGYVLQSALPYMVDGQGVIYKAVPPASDSSMRMCYTWWDGTHETTPSPAATVQVPAWHDFYCTLPARAGLSKRVYVEFSTVPNVWYRTTAAESSTVVSYGNFGGGPQPLPTTNTFPNADPATLKSTNNKFVVHGDGSGSWGPLTFNADGTMTSTQIPAWVPVTSFLNSWGPESGWFVPAYRVWPDGKVEWRGALGKGAAVSTGEVVFNIPVAARPTQNAGFAARGTSSGSTSVAGFDFRAGTNDAAVFPSAAIQRVSLDGIYYYKD